MPNLRTIIAAPIIILSTAFCGSLAVLQSFFDRAGKSIDQTSLLWARLLSGAAGMTVDSSGAEKIDPTRTYVVVSNHQSHMDTVALYLSCPVPIRMLAKEELFRIPIFGSAMAKAGHIKISRDKSRKTDFSKLLSQVESLKKAGRSVMVFAEGTRSDDGEIAAFKHGAFLIASHFSLPILPVAIKGTKEILPSRAVRFSAGKVKVVYHAPIEPGAEQPAALAETVRSIIVKSLEEMKDGTVNSQ